MQDVLKGPTRSEFLRYFNTPAASQQHLQHMDAMLHGTSPMAAQVGTPSAPRSKDQQQQHGRGAANGPAPATATGNSTPTKGDAPKQLQPRLLPQPTGGAGPPHMPRPQGNPSDAALQAPQPQPLAPSLSAPVHPRRVPVAHFVGQVPHRIMHALRLPPTNGVAAAGVAHAEHACASASAAASTQHMLAVQGAVCWAAAPTLTDPDTSITHSIAVHRSLEQALAVALDGDVVLLQPGRYSLGGSTGSGSGGEDAGGSCPAAAGGMQVPWVMEGGPLRRSIRIIGLGARRQVRQTANCSPFLSSVSALCWVQCSKMCCPDVVECVNATAS